MSLFIAEKSSLASGFYREICEKTAAKAVPANGTPVRRGSGHGSCFRSKHMPKNVLNLLYEELLVLSRFCIFEYYQA